MRVLANAEAIAVHEGADPDIVVPAALFHDIVNIPKDDPAANEAPDRSAEIVRRLLNGIDTYPQEKIAAVCEAVRSCSFSKGVIPVALEAKILQDADGLESTGAISIMRTFASTGQMRRPFYAPEDPFCERRTPESTRYALDLFFSRLLIVEGRMHTVYAKEIAQRRTMFLNVFLDEFRKELGEH